VEATQLDWMAGMTDAAELAGLLSPALQKLALRYVSNAITAPARRRLRVANPFVAQLTSSAAGLPLLCAAGFEESGEYLEVSEHSLGRLTSVEAALAAQAQAPDDALIAQAPDEAASLLRLPNDLLVQCLHHLDAEDLCAWQRSCHDATTAADGAQLLWLRLCAEPLRRGIRTLDAAQQARLPPARQIYRLERVWAMLESRAGQQVRCSLRRGLPPHSAALRSSLGLPAQVPAYAYARAHAHAHARPTCTACTCCTVHAYVRCPPQVMASLLIHDGQHATTAAEAGPGLQAIE
jgi:hypothetical protein